ncbi:hypothetical protein [Roseateles depolymerans]|uniref:Uncharacterized protein n=1 Tax=Roseateles depolymerans TaxID=76731 RepID=A0A0U3MK04_9BURK|nr:hypothetical protein [Roseateles depolymerans]ALV08793.1 hypothetical protein RD2015_4350 [Roseateles depolymerans]REG20976.1 hypothetical protein DES44_0085 [Roseateles depolymerans]
MQKLSPVKVVAALTAILMAVVFLVVATRMREGAAGMFSAARANTAKRPPASAPAVEPGARASGSRVIPIGVVPASAPTR